MVKFSKSLSKTLIMTVALATFLSTAVQLQSVQAATSSASKGKGGTVITQPTLTDDQKAAAAVDKKISLLPKLNKITLANETAINGANLAYNTLTEIQKTLVKPANVATLNAAVGKIAELKISSEVDVLISALPKLNKITLANEEAVNAANVAYNALTDIQKPLVKPANVATLNAAVGKIADLKKSTVVDVLITALPKVDKITLADATSINEAYAAYTALTKSQKALLTSSNSGKMISSINKLKSLNGDAKKALSELNSGKKAFSNFRKAGITGAVEENNILYFTEIAKAKTAKGSALTLEEIQAIVDTVNKNVSAATGLAVINTGTEVFTDFAKAGITGAVEGNKLAYDAEIAGAKATKGTALTLAEVQAIVDSVNQIVVDSQAAQVVINQIAALDNTKDTYAADVAAAKQAYEMLTDAQKALVTNYDILVNAIQSLV